MRVIASDRCAKAAEAGRQVGSRYMTMLRRIIGLRRTEREGEGTGGEGEQV